MRKFTVTVNGQDYDVVVKDGGAAAAAPSGTACLLCQPKRHLRGFPPGLSAEACGSPKDECSGVMELAAT